MYDQGSKIALVRSYLRFPKAAGQVKIFIFLLKIKFLSIYANIFVMQGKCLFSDILRPDDYACTTESYGPIRIATNDD